MDDFIKTLKQKEKELLSKLESTPLFKQLEGIRSTINLFANGHSENGQQSVFQQNIPESYSVGNLTWREKILFVLNKLNGGYISDMVTELKKLGEKEDDDWLDKRVRVTISRIKKSDKNINVKKMGKKSLFSLK